MPLTTKEFADRRPPWQRVAGAVAIACAAALVVVMVVRGHGDEQEASRAAPSSETTQSVGKGSVLPQTPSLVRTPSDPKWLTAAPHYISWQRVDGVPFPFSDSDGPSTIRGAIASGYSHTPQGAVMAAAHITFRLTWSPDYAAVLAAQTKVTETTRTQLLAARDHGGTIPTEMLAQVATAPVAFKVASYTPNAARVYLAFPTHTDKYRFAPVAVVWDAGDWKFSDDVSSTPALPDSATMSGFTSLREER